MKIYKGYQIKASPKSPQCVLIVTDGKGGKIPTVLEGLFTSAQLAMDMIDSYLETKPIKDK